MDRLKIIKQWITNWTTITQLAKISKLSDDIMWDVVNGRTALNDAKYKKIYKWMDKKIQKDIDLLQDFGVKN